MKGKHQKENVTGNEPRTEQALRASELSYRRLFEAAKDGILILDVDTGRINDANPFLSKLLGFSRNEMLGKTVGELSPFKDIESNQAMLERLQKDGYVRYEDLPLETRDGRKIAVEFVSNVYQAGDCNVIQCNVRDITDRKGMEEQRVVERRRLEAQFIEAQKMEVIGKLASGVAHDFNNILGIIMGYGDLITAQLDPDSPLRKCTEEIRHASVRAAGLTRQLLVFSRKQTVLPVVLDLNDVVKDLDKMLRRLIDENIEMTIVPGKQIGRIKADSGYVGQVLMNLVVNARDAMPNGGKLTIATNNVTLDENYAHTHTGVIPGDYVMLSVSDTGTGMTDEVKARLFEAFFTTKPTGKGTGLGLATCQTIVQQSGGHIGVYSEVGKGTTFKIYFPRVEQPLDVTARSIQTGPLPRGTETLLVVEDEPTVRHLANHVLENQGYTVLRAMNGQHALHLAQEHKGPPIRLVITDVIMPQMGGKVMAERLKTTCPDLKILFTSGYTDDTIAQHGVLEPGVAFLPKPYTTAALARKVRAMLDNETDTALLRKQGGRHDATAIREKCSKRRATGVVRHFLSETDVPPLIQEEDFNMNAPLPENETERLAALRSYQILDTPPDTEFDLLTALASQICAAPIAMMSLVDEHRQWFKSKVGVSISETRRDIAFCAHAILQRDVMEVDDASADKRFADNPLVTSPPNIRFYAGAPLVTKEGCALGVMCVLDRKPRTLSNEQRTGLAMLGQLAMVILDFRKKLGEVSKVASEREWLVTELKQALAKAERP